MARIASISLALVILLIALLGGLQIRAQTAQQTWSTFLGDDQTALQPNRIKIDYQQPSDANFQALHDMLVERRALEQVQEIFSPLRLPLDLTVRIKDCGMSNAWYQRPTITICYEYVRDLIQTAPTQISPEGITPMDALAGQFLYTASHEMGHAVFDLLDVPLFGRPEDDADQFAAHVIIRIGQHDARRLIAGAAYMYKDYVKHPTITVPVTAFADVHGAPMQRLYNLPADVVALNGDDLYLLVGNTDTGKTTITQTAKSGDQVKRAFNDFLIINPIMTIFDGRLYYYTQTKNAFAVASVTLALQDRRLHLERLFNGEQIGVDGCAIYVSTTDQQIERVVR